MPNLSRLFGQSLGVAGNAIEGYDIDKRRRVASVLAERKQKQDEDRDRVLNALASAQTNRINNPLPEPVEYSPTKFMAAGKPVQGFTTKAGGYFDANLQPVADAAPYEEPKTPPTAPNLTFQTLAGADGQPAKIVALDPKTGEKVREIGDKPVGGSGLSGAALKTAIAENRTQMKFIEDAMAALTDNPTATGLKRGLGAIPGLSKIGEIANQKLDPAGSPTRDRLGRVGSVVVKDISGGAVTGPEWARLGWVPDAAYDSARNLEKLKAMYDFAKTKTEEMERAMAGGGSAPPGGSAGAGSAAGKTLTPEQYQRAKQYYSDDEIRAQGYAIP